MIEYCWKRAGLLFFFSLLLQNVFAQSFRNFGIEEGLSQNFVYAITQGEDGSLAISTGDGLVMYDGISLTPFYEKDGLTDNFITSSYRDNEGIIWFGHYEGGVTTYRDDTFSQMKLEKKISNIISIQEAHDGLIWFASRNSGLFSWDKKDQHFQYYLTDVNFSINDFVPFNNEQFLLGTNQGIRVFDTQTGEVKSAKFGIPEIKITALTKRSKGNTFWVGTDGYGVFELNNIKGEWRKKIYKEEFNLISNRVECLAEDLEGNLWVGTRDGISKISYLNGTSSLKGFDINHGLPSNYIKSIFCDREGNMWFGTYGGGLSQLKDQLFSIFTDPKNETHEITSVINDSKNRLWIGTKHGLLVLERNKEGFIRSQTTFLDELHITALHEDKKHRIWIGTSNNGLYFVNSHEQKVEIQKSSFQLSSNDISHITSDVQQNIWVSTLTSGVDVFYLDGNKKNMNTHNGLSRNDVMMTFVDSKNRVWFATRGGGLCKYENGEIEILDEKDRLVGHDFNAITEDKDGAIWVASYGKGIFKYEEGAFVNINKLDGLLSDYTYSITVDSQNNIWVSTSLGLCKFDQSKSEMYVFQSKNNFNGASFRSVNTHKDRDGNIWFPADKSVVRLAVKNQIENKLEPITKIKSVKIFDEPFDLSKPILLSYANYRIDIEFVGISLTTPEKVKYQYKLKGHERDWSEVSNVPRARYSNLREGSYVFQVRAANNDGLWNNEPTEIELTIAPPFWKTWWFIFLVIVVVIGIVVIIIYVREINANRIKAYLQETLKIRTREVVQQKEELEIQNNEIKSSITYARRIQDAVLPDISAMEHYLSGSFVFYKPRDIVSGDFYWISHQKNKLIVVAADCTGHGVPGAFMSLLGTTALNHVVNEHKTIKPSEILMELNGYIRETLLKEEKAKSVTDGMDITICTIDKTTKTIEFAGAKNPLYILRNKEIEVIKGDRYSIGEEHVEFTNHIIQTEQGDQFYIFSDGFPDQFGGEKDKKYTYARFRELLKSIGEREMKKQVEEMEQNFEDWRGELEQIDDVLVIGFQL